MTDNELPGMWEASDLSGGEADGYERRLPVRSADAAQYAREAIPMADRGRIRVRLLNATPDPLGSVAALIAQYSGRVIRDLSEVTDAERRAALDDMGKTVLNGPLEAVQFHWQVEGVTRSITHQMVRSRAAFFAQESLRFAVAEGDWAEEVPLPPSLAGIDRWNEEQVAHAMDSDAYRQYIVWQQTIRRIQSGYRSLIELGMPAEEARGVLPHDIPTRIHWVCDLRTLLAEAGKRTCTQAQFPWRMIFAGVASELRRYKSVSGLTADYDGWQFRMIADKIRPVCYQTGECGFMAKFDRSCNIRERVEANAAIGRPSSAWHQTWLAEDPADTIPAISDAEWALNPAAARS